jgi:hypothetical protein
VEHARARRRSLPAGRRGGDRQRRALDPGDADHGHPGGHRDDSTLGPRRSAGRTVGQPADDRALPSAHPAPGDPPEPAGALRIDRQRGRRLPQRPPGPAARLPALRPSGDLRTAPPRAVGQDRSHGDLRRSDLRAPAHRADARPTRAGDGRHLLPACRRLPDAPAERTAPRHPPDGPARPWTTARHPGGGLFLRGTAARLRGGAGGIRAQRVRGVASRSRSDPVRELLHVVRPAGRRLPRSLGADDLSVLARSAPPRRPRQTRLGCLPDRHTKRPRSRRGRSARSRYWKISVVQSPPGR